MKTVLITGASRGIGRACAERFAQQGGHQITAVARTIAQLRDLEQLYPGRIEPLAADLTEAEIDGEYDVVILNAGYFAPGGLLDPERDVFAESWQLNVMANHRLCRRLLPPLVARGRGHLIVIGSTATDDTSAHMTAYAATKKALRALYEGWETELAGSGVLTTLVAPGATLTSSWDDEAPPPLILQAAQVAELVYEAVEQGLTGRLVIKADGQA